MTAPTVRQAERADKMNSIVVIEGNPLISTVMPNWYRNPVQRWHVRACTGAMAITVDDDLGSCALLVVYHSWKWMIKPGFWDQIDKFARLCNRQGIPVFVFGKKTLQRL